MSKQQSTIALLQKQLDNICKKTHSGFIAIVGLKGNIKGIDILYSLAPKSIYDVKTMRWMNGKLTEYYLKFQNLEIFPDSVQIKHDFIEMINYQYSQSLKICILPLEWNDDFIITTVTPEPNKILKFLLKIRILLYKLKEERKAF